ncbi:ATP-binding protein [Actinomadura keratinilytica]
MPGAPRVRRQRRPDAPHRTHSGPGCGTRPRTGRGGGRARGTARRYGGFSHGPEPPGPAPAGRRRPAPHTRRPAAGPRRAAAPSSAGPRPRPARAAPRAHRRTRRRGHLVTVNPVDGSEIEVCPPGRHPSPPVRRTPDDRAALAAAARPPAPPGVPRTHHRLLGRDRERDTLVQLLARGRSVRLTGARGSGRTVLLDAVAARCEGLAPDGVVRLDGHHRTADELLHALCAAVHLLPAHRPGPALLAELAGEIGAVVLIDDAEIGGAALDSFLAATPECAVLLACTPEVPAPGEEAGVEEVVLEGIGRSGGLTLLAQGASRALSEDEVSWAGDLWFESEGLPLRFVQAGALLHQRDLLREESGSAEAPLPTVAEGAAPAALLASRLSEAARATLGFAYALGGEVPHQAHLPALVGDTHADAALTELLDCGLVTPVGNRYRLAAGVTEQLAAEGYADEGERAHTAAQHYTWWTGHPSVTPERAAAESDAVLAALTALVGGQDPARQATAVLLARTVAPVLAAALPGAPGSGCCAPARRPPASPARSPRRRTSTTSWASWRSARTGSTGPAPSWRPPSRCAAPSPTSAAPSPPPGPRAGRRPRGETVPVTRAVLPTDGPLVPPRREGVATPPTGLPRTTPLPGSPGSSGRPGHRCDRRGRPRRDGRQGRQARPGRPHRRPAQPGRGRRGRPARRGPRHGRHPRRHQRRRRGARFRRPGHHRADDARGRGRRGHGGGAARRLRRAQHRPGRGRRHRHSRRPDAQRQRLALRIGVGRAQQLAHRPPDRLPSDRPTTKPPSTPPTSSKPPTTPPPSSPDPEPSDTTPTEDPDPEDPEPGTDNSASGPAPEPSTSQMLS